MASVGSDEDDRVDITLPRRTITDGPGSGLPEPYARRLAWGENLVVALVYMGVAAIGFWPAFLHGFSRTSGCGCWDYAQQQWFLGWDAHALAQWHGFFVAHALNAPYGVNVLWNPSMLLAGTVFAPVTWAFGPIATFNLLMFLGFCGSAMTMYLALRRWTNSILSRFVGGLAYGFSPFAVAHVYGGHVNFVIGWLPPLILVACHEILVRQMWRTRRAGVVLGLLVAAQFFLTEEVVAECAALLAAGALILAVRFRSALRDHLAYAFRAFVWSGATFAILCGVPLIVQLFGPGHIHGPVQPYSQLNIFSIDLLSTVIPTQVQALIPSSLVHFQQLFSGGYAPEISAYVGVPLLVTILVSAVVLRRDRALMTFIWLFVVAVVLSLGPVLRVDGHKTSIPLPFAVLRHLPLFSSEISARYGQFIALFAAVVLAMTVDSLQARFPTIARPPHAGLQTGTAKAVFGRAVPAMVATLCLLPLVPRWPYPMIQNRIPAFFTGSDVKKIPQSSTMLYYPFPRFDSAQIMVWQAFAQFRFGLFGGYAVMPDGKGNGSLAPRQSLVQDTLLSFSNPQGGAPVLTGPLVDDLRRELCADGVSTFLLASTAERAQAVAGLFTLLSGRAGVAEDGFILWSGVSTCR